MLVLEFESSRELWVKDQDNEKPESQLWRDKRREPDACDKASSLDVQVCGPGTDDAYERLYRVVGS